jgi:hypothetical protein
MGFQIFHRTHVLLQDDSGKKILSSWSAPSLLSSWSEAKERSRVVRSHSKHGLTSRSFVGLASSSKMAGGGNWTSVLLMVTMSTGCTACLFELRIKLIPFNHHNNPRENQTSKYNKDDNCYIKRIVHQGMISKISSNQFNKG